MSRKNKPIKIGVIPDTQVRPGDDLRYLAGIGQYMLDKQPDVWVMLGDFADMSSLEQHSKVGSKGREGRRYRDDVEVVKEGMRTLLAPLKKYQKKNKYKPKMIFTTGNHENRIERFIEDNPLLEQSMLLEDLNFKSDWDVIPFLQPVTVAGIAFCHYFVSGVMGRPITSARALITKLHMSCIAGHQQGRDIAYGKAADGRDITALIAGSCYEHEEPYLNHQSNNHWRGLYILHNCIDGSFDELAVPLSYITNKYC